jgi:hypothetical protein
VEKIQFGLNGSRKSEHAVKKKFSNRSTNKPLESSSVHKQMLYGLKDM